MTAVGARPIVGVNSGRYVEQELAAEFGPLPPALLPVGLTRLYELQAQLFAPLNGDLYLAEADTGAVRRLIGAALCS